MVDNGDVPKGRPKERGAVSPSAFLPALTQMADYYANIDVMASNFAAAMSVPKIESSLFNIGLAFRQVDVVADIVREQFEPLNNFIAEANRVAELVGRLYDDQWQRFFKSLSTLRWDIYPKNLSDAEPSAASVEAVLVDEGIPLMWVPRSSVVRALLEAPDAAARRQLIGRRWKSIVRDCEDVLETIDNADLRASLGFASECLHALREGHANAAQALAANLLDTLMQHFDDVTRKKVTRNEFKRKGVKFDLDDFTIRAAFTFAPVWFAHAEYWPKNGDPIPRVFGRHPSVHGVSKRQYSRINAVIGVMLVTSILKFFDLELPR